MVDLTNLNKADAGADKVKTIVINQYNNGGGLGGGWGARRRCAKGKAGKKCRKNRRAARIQYWKSQSQAYNGKETEYKGEYYRVTPGESWMLKKLDYKQVGDVTVNVDEGDDTENYQGPPDKVEDWDFEKIASGANKISWDFVGGAAGFQDLALRKIPDFDFEITFDFKTKQKGNIGLFSI
jgi:hypothetical protein